MRLQDLRNLVHHRPFQPFRVRMSNGETYEVQHPELVVVGRSWLHLFFEDPEIKGVADRFKFLSLLHIVEIEPISDGKVQAN